MRPRDHAPYTVDMLNDEKERKKAMTNNFANISTLDISIELEQYTPTDKWQLIIDTLHAEYEFILTDEQVKMLREKLSNFKTKEEEFDMMEKMK